MFTNGLIIGLQLRAQMETHWLSGKEKVADAAVRRESHNDSFQEHESVNYYCFFGFYVISTFESYLMPNPFLYK